MAVRCIALPMLILLLFAAIAIIILFIKLCSKRPWIAVVLILVLLLLLAPVVYLRSERRVAYHRADVSRELRHHYRSDGVATVETDTEGSSMGLRQIRSEAAPTAIWQPGIEDEFEADVYPSQLSAVRSLGLRIGRAVQRVLDAEAAPSRFVLFQGAHERSLIEEFGRAVDRAFPETQWFVEPETVGVQPDEVGIHLRIVDTRTQPVPWRSDFKSNVTSGRIEATAIAKSKQCTINTRFVEKPWVEDFSGFLNNKPNSRFLIARSAQSCLTEAEANRQALDSACAQVCDMLSRISRRRSGVPAPLASRVDSDDILEGDLILDRFVQSFDGSAGRIWREALLIDGSTGKLERLAHRKAVMARAVKMNLARTFITAFGLLLLITIVYVFLNAATKGYYVWSLRIAGVVLAAIAIILLLA
jgi:hypothetical protein